MSNVVHIGDAAKRVAQKAGESMLMNQLREAKRQLEGDAQAERIRELHNFQRRCLLEATIRDMREKEGDLVTMDYLSDTLKAIGGGT